MNQDHRKERYWQALHQLSELVVKRNGYLLELEKMATLPLGLSPAAGLVAKFDSGKGRALMAHLNKLDQRIDAAITELRREAEVVGMPPVEWLDTPDRRGEASARGGGG